jgi:hypothetical protein
LWIEYFYIKIELYLLSWGFDDKMDDCKPIRKTYDAVLKLLASNHYVAMFVTSCPILYIFVYVVSNSVSGSVGAFGILSYLNNIGYTIFGVLLLAWAVGCASIWKKMPNLLSLGIFVYKCIGHWTLVSFVMIVLYVTSYAGVRVTGWLTMGFLPSIVLLLFAADVMRAVRHRLFEELAGEGAMATAVEDGGGATATATATAV